MVCSSVEWIEGGRARGGGGSCRLRVGGSHIRTYTLGEEGGGYKSTKKCKMGKIK